MSADRDTDDLDLLTDAVRGAASLALQYFERPVDVWHKRPNDPVSEADIAVNRYLRERLRRARPDYGWLSEESEDDPDRLRRERLWVVDPIDGTRAFLRGQAEFAVSVALVEGDRPLMGAVLQPVTGTLYRAVRGQGASRDHHPLQVSARAALAGCHMLADPAFFRARRHWPVPWPDMDYRRVPSLALRLAFVAAGGADAMVSIGRKHDWDLAAADLIVEEAGGRVVDATGSRLRYNRERPTQSCVIAAAPALIAPILARVVPAMARRDAANRDACDDQK
ncbi:MAG: 3'(2'),5'-bisphosphate nucleotidase CysQ [Rhodothalassiaceae bacterium]